MYVPSVAAADEVDALMCSAVHAGSGLYEQQSISRMLQQADLLSEFI
jgi:hypothetical protein